MRRRFWLAVSLFLLTSPAQAYIDITSTLGDVINESTTIMVVQVDKVSQEKKAIVFKKVADLKGKTPDGPVRHHIADGAHPREPKLIMEWAEPGKLAVCFTTGKSALVCTGPYWYECAALEGPWWTMTYGRPELSLAYYGTPEKLRAALPPILAGKEVIITAVNHGTRSGVFQYNHVAFQKVLRGKDCPVWRIRASLKMPTCTWEIGSKDSRWVVGPGVAGPEDVPGFVRDLASKDARIRAHAADDLGLIGWGGRAAVPDLLKAFDDADPLVRVSAARAVVFIGEDGALPLAVLQAVLKSPTPAARKAAAAALGDLSSDARAAVPALREALRDPEASVRWSAAEALGRIGPAAESAVPALAEALRDPALRAIAADALGGIGPAARGAVPLLLDALKDTDADFRGTAAVALSRIDPKSARAAVPLFIERMKSPELRTRWDVLMILAPMGAEAKDAADAVRVMVRSGNGVAASTLAAIAGPDAVDALPTLLYVLADDWDTSEDIAKVGAAALPGLLEILKDPEATNRHLAIKTLGLLGPKCHGVIPTLIGALKDPDRVVRAAAATALTGIEPRVKAAVGPLTAALKDDDSGVRLAAATALRVIQGPEASPAIPVLVALLSDKDAGVRRDAVAALADFGAAAKDALPPLKGAVEDADAGVRNAAARAVARITAAEANCRAVGVHVAALKDKDPRTRQEAARFLGAVGPDARDAVAALSAARQDEDEDVRKAATEALVKIQAR